MKVTDCLENGNICLGQSDVILKTARNCYAPARVESMPQVLEVIKR